VYVNFIKILWKQKRQEHKCFSFLSGPKPLPLGEENPCVNYSYRDSIDEYQDHDPWHTLPLQDQDINPPFHRCWDPPHCYTIEAITTKIFTTASYQCDPFTMISMFSLMHWDSHYIMSTRSSLKSSSWWLLQHIFVITVYLLRQWFSLLLHHVTLVTVMMLRLHHSFIIGMLGLEYNFFLLYIDNNTSQDT